MAKPASPSAPASAIVTTNPAAVSAALDAAANVTSMVGLTQEQIEIQNHEAQIARFLSGNVLEQINKVVAAKKEDFSAPEVDFWKPKDPGSSKELRGIYMGCATYGRLIQHAVATKSPSGKAIAMRFNGAHGLTRMLKNYGPGTPILIEWLGETGTMSGNKFGQWRVSPLLTK